MTSFAFVFPGQGSQSVGMVNAWGDHPAVRETLAEASAALGQDLAALMRDGPQDELDLTTNTQPVMLAAGIACWRAWRAEGGAEPAAVAGHSLGEYSALVAAGVLGLGEAVKLVRFRAQAMQQAVPVGTGAMAAVLALQPAQVVEGCAKAAADSGEVVEAANFNDPRQTVISGTVAGVEKAREVLKAMGAKRVVQLPVSAPFHCSLMRPAAEALRERLASVPLAAPRFVLVNNVDVAAPVDAAAIRDALYRQAFGPVRWVEVVQALRARGCTHIVECGPGKVLAGMVKRIDEQAQVLTLSDPATLAECKETCLLYTSPSPRDH
jgi:[acyl-carrier-protein] S-malonyltransferase